MNRLTAFKQRGAFSILAAGTLLLTLGCTMLVMDTGRLYMEQRKLQKLADTAALESIARLNSGRCADAPDTVQTYAQENATRNGFLTQDSQSMMTRCVAIEVIEGIRTPCPDEDKKCKGGYKDEDKKHAVEAIATETVPASLLFRAGNLLGLSDKNEITMQATAVAEREGGAPTATFTLGAELLRLDNSKLLGQLLKVVGVDADRLTVLNSNGLADASITPSGLLKALGIEASIYELKALSPQGLVDLVDTQVGLLGIDRLIDVSLEVISDNVLKAELEALRLEILSNPLLKDVQLSLFGTEDMPGLITLASAPDGTLGPALDAGVNLGDLLGTSILIGTSERALEIPELNVLGLAKVQLGIVEPPTIAVGPVGTMAYNAQIRLYVDIDSNKLLGGALSWLTDAVLGLRVHLPLTVDVTTAQAEFISAQCTENPPTATFEVNSSVLNTCIGEMPAANRWSGSARCEENLQTTQIIKLLHLPLLTGKTHIEGLSYIEETEPLAEGDIYSTEPNSVALGDTVENIVLGLLDLLGGVFRAPQTVDDSHLEYTDSSKDKFIADLSKQYLESTKDSLGRYDIDKVIDLVLHGSNEVNPETGSPLLPPMVSEDWIAPNSVPKKRLLGLLGITWEDGLFSEAFKGLTSENNGLLSGLIDGVLLNTLKGLLGSDGYRVCYDVLGLDLPTKNACIQHNLTKFLQDKPGGIDLSSGSDADSLLDLQSDTFTCTNGGLLCILLKPVLVLLKPILNGVGALLDTLLADVLGLELGRSDLHLQELNCGAPRLVN